MEFSLPLRVYIEDTDAGGIVYYVNYLKYMERARTEYMREQGFAKGEIFNSRLMFVVRSATLDYRASAQLDDDLHVTARVKRVRGASMVFEQSVIKGQQLLVDAEIKIACVDAETRVPKPIPAEMRAKLGDQQSRRS